MMIDSYESVNALVSRPNKKSSIALYIPPNSLKTAFGASYEGLDSGATKAKTFGGTFGDASVIYLGTKY